MKDLYFEMSLEPDASDADIAAVLEQRPELRDYSAILLNRDRRTYYDRTHATLKTIGELRHRLKLDSGDSWFLEHFSDFAHRFNPALAPAPPKADLADATPATAAPQTSAPQIDLPEKPASRKRLVTVILGVVVLILLLMAITYF